MNPHPGAPGLIIAAPRSGAGKTTVTLGLLRALRRRGCVVQPFKCGPDYIDPAFHEVAAGRPSFNLDSWAMDEGLIANLATNASAGADISIAEGVMGLFDGAAARGQCGTGATADLAALLGWPVVLVLDVTGQTETAAAVALGCARYSDGVDVAGVILNRVASDRHFSLVAPAFDRIKMRVFGAILREDRLVLPERHLGLVHALEITTIDYRMDALADVIDAAIDLGAIRQSARPPRVAMEIPGAQSDRARSQLQPPGQRIALAQDRAFSFIYPHILRNGGWLERKSFRSRHWRMRLPMRRLTPSGCLAAIRNSMPAPWRPPTGSEEVCMRLPAAPFPSTASVAATWCWGGGSKMPTVTSTKWPACSGSKLLSRNASCT